MRKLRIISILLAWYTLYIFSCDNQNYKNLFENKNIFITGGSGFLGRALIKEILKYNPHKIIIFSRDEVKHYKLFKKIINTKLKAILGDIRDSDALLQATKQVDIVIHAAALKRIDMLENNVFESIQTNILGTYNIFKACIENNIKKALLVSTDKACLPINTYGACKFIAEKIFTNFSQKECPTSFMVVRYGNILQSTGSIIPYFFEKIKNKQPLTLTDPKMTRFFITKEQGVNIIFKALHYGIGGEIFVPIIPSFRITDLIAILQQKFGETDKIQIIGLRPGEKIHEVLINHSEIPRTYKFNDMFVITPNIYHKNERALYKTEGILLNPTSFFEYTSSTVSSAENLMLLLESNSILKKSINKKGSK